MNFKKKDVSSASHHYKTSGDGSASRLKKQTMKAKQPIRMSSVRVIAGQWKRRLVSFPELPGVRPTPNRLRETLFQWLEPMIHQAHVLDPFAGTGILGIEALSRGALSLVSIDFEPQLIESMKALQETWASNPSWELQSSASPGVFDQLDPKHKFNLVFLDPPYDLGLWLPSLEAIVKHGLLANNVWIYLELPSRDAEDILKAIFEEQDWSQLGWAWYRHRESRCSNALGSLWRGEYTSVSSDG